MVQTNKLKRLRFYAVVNDNQINQSFGNLNVFRLIAGIEGDNFVLNFEDEDTNLQRMNLIYKIQIETDIGRYLLACRRIWVENALFRSYGLQMPFWIWLKLTAQPPQSIVITVSNLCEFFKL